jgi:hypothetical protein
MLRVLAFDQSVTRTGYAFDKGGKPDEIEFGSFSCAEGHDAFQVRERLGRRVKQLISLYRPEFVIWEKARQHITAYPKKKPADLVEPAGIAGVTVSAKQLLLPGIEGVLHGLCIAYGIACDSPSPATWRKVTLGNGALGTDEAKEAALAHCRRLKVAVANHDEAEAVCIALYSPSSQIYRRAFSAKRAAR